MAVAARVVAALAAHATSQARGLPLPLAASLKACEARGGGRENATRIQPKAGASHVAQGRPEGLPRGGSDLPQALWEALAGAALHATTLRPKLWH